LNVLRKVDQEAVTAALCTTIRNNMAEAPKSPILGKDAHGRRKGKERRKYVQSEEAPGLGFEVLYQEN